MVDRLSNRLLSSLRILRKDESGQSLIIVAISMSVALGISAFAIDVATWYQRHHQAQIAVDAAALAAANCLANSGGHQACKNHKDVAGAQAIAVEYAARNGVAIKASQVAVDTKKDIVTVNASTTAPAFFARIFGIHKATVGVGSGAAWKVATAQLPCNSTSSAGCAAIYAANTACDNGKGILLSTQGTNSGHAALQVTGILHSEGAMQLGNATHASGLTVAGSCYTSSNMPSSGKMTASQVSPEPWPVDYTQSFPACTTDCKTVDGVSGVPPFCNHATTSSTGYTFSDVKGTQQLPVEGDIYCSIGEIGNTWYNPALGHDVTVTASDPTTWDGPIEFQTSDPANPGQCNNGGTFASATFIGGDITADQTQGPMCLQPAPGTNLLFWSNGTIKLRQAIQWTGDMFDPAGTIQLGSTGSTSTGQGTGGGHFTSTAGLIEALNFSDANVSLDLVGDGPGVPTGSGDGSTTSGSDQLVS